MSEEKKFGGRLENWGEFSWSGSLLGDIYDDPRERWPDGTTIRTSRLVGDNTLLEGSYAETKNTFYLLGKECVPK